MKWIPRGMALLAVGLVVLPSCKKKHSERAASDLGEAGYQLTAEDWFRATEQDNVAVMKKFLAGGFAADTRKPDGDSALHVAAAAGALKAADYLLDRKLPVDVRGASERTPLMAAVIANQPEMTAWLLRQGADAHLKDRDGFKPLMLAAREGSARCVGELANHDREDLDAALLLAALDGRADVIDALTSYGASVYSRMEDGRTPLMIAAENGHEEAVKLLLEIGSSRFTTDADGRSAAEIATSAGHPEIAEMVSRDPKPDEFALESPEQIAGAMEAFVDRSVETAGSVAVRPGSNLRPSAKPLQGEILSNPAADEGAPAVAAGGGSPRSAAPFAMPPLVMRHYREKEIPVSVASVRGETATLRVAGRPKDITVRAGDVIPGSDLVVVRVQRRLEDSKLSAGKEVEISVVQVRDKANGVTREWISGFSSEAHEPVALVEDSATGKRYIASPGQRFSAENGAEYVVSEVRPNQLVIREESTGAMRTIPLRGPRG